MDHTHIHALDLAPTFDLAHFLACAGVGRRIVHYDPKGRSPQLRGKRKFLS